ncbi:MAG: hypothetical protein WBF67_10810 [Olleya sp.]
MSAKPIDINDALDYARKWQNENKTHAKAHLIPAGDLIACLEEMKVLVNDGKGNYTLNNVDKSGVRAYMAIKRPNGTKPSPETEHLLMVGTLVDCNGVHRDIVEGEKPSGCKNCDADATVAALAGSGVFDVTLPCPSECDTNSPLYNP